MNEVDKLVIMAEGNEYALHAPKAKATKTNVLYMYVIAASNACSLGSNGATEKALNTSPIYQSSTAEGFGGLLL